MKTWFISLYLELKCKIVALKTVCFVFASLLLFGKPHLLSIVLQEEEWSGRVPAE